MVEQPLGPRIAHEAQERRLPRRMQNLEFDRASVLELERAREPLNQSAVRPDVHVDSLLGFIRDAPMDRGLGRGTDTDQEREEHQAACRHIPSISLRLCLHGASVEIDTLIVPAGTDSLPAGMTSIARL